MRLDEIAPVVACTTLALVMVAAALRVRGGARGPWGLTAGMAAAALAYSLFEMLSAPGHALAVGFWASRLQFIAGAAWCVFAVPLYTRTPLRPRSPARWALAGALGLSALLALVPGALLVPWPQEPARPLATPAGQAVAALYVLTLLRLLGRSLRDAWRREPGALASGLALGLLVLTGINDALLVSGVWSTIPLVSVGLAAQGLVISMSMVRDEVMHERALADLANALEAQVATRSAELARAREEVVRNEKLAALGRLSAGVAHEINNPAGIVLASLQYLDHELSKDSSASEETREALRDGIVGVERIARVVRQLQDSGRPVSAGPAELAPTPARAAVERALTLTAAATRPGIEVRDEVAGDLWVVANQRLLEQSLFNVLLNAIAAAGEGGRNGTVRIRALRGEGRVRLVVEDDGPGVPERHQANLFEPFFSTRAVGEGMGMGLAVARSLVEAQRGALTLDESRPGRTAFSISLEEAAEADSPAPRPTPFPPRARAAVLIIDDDALVRRALGRQLSAHYEVAVAETVAEGLALIEAAPTRFSAVLCDIVMPDGGGRTLVPELRRRWPALESRTLFVTGGTTSESADTFYDEHFGQVLQKPIDTRTLLAAVAERVGQAPAASVAAASAQQSGH